jgi:hypothetical protein
VGIGPYEGNILFDFPLDYGKIYGQKQDYSRQQSEHTPSHNGNKRCAKPTAHNSRSQFGYNE